MRRMMFAGGVAGAALLTGYGSAAAQAIVVEPPAEVYIAPASPPGYYYEYYGYRPGPRVYGYYPSFRDADEGGDVVVVRPRYRGGCGAYAYWDGTRCIDARY